MINAPTLVNQFWRSHSQLGQSRIQLKTRIQTLPYRAQLSYRPKGGSFDFVEIMVERVWKLNEITVFAIDCKLYLAQHIPISYIYQNIVGPLLQPINYPHQLNITLLQSRLIDNLIIDSYNFLFSRNTTTSKQVHNLKGNDINGRIDVRVVFTKLRCRSKQSMNESIQILDCIWMQIVDNSTWITSCYQLIILNVITMLHT